MDKQLFDTIAFIIVPIVIGILWGGSDTIEDCKRVLTEATNKFLAWFVVFIVVPIGLTIPYVGIALLIEQFIF